MTGLFFSLTLGGVVLGAVLVGALFDTVGIGGGLAVSARAIAACGVWMLREEPAEA